MWHEIFGGYTPVRVNQEAIELANWYYRTCDEFDKKVVPPGGIPWGDEQYRLIAQHAKEAMEIVRYKCDQKVISEEELKEAMKIASGRYNIKSQEENWYCKI